MHGRPCARRMMAASRRYDRRGRRAAARGACAAAGRRRRGPDRPAGAAARCRTASAYSRKLECLQPTGSVKVRGFFARRCCWTRGGSTARAADRQRRQRRRRPAPSVAGEQGVDGVPCRGRRCSTRRAREREDRQPARRRAGARPVSFLPGRDDELLAWMGREGWRDEPEVFVHPFAGEELIAGHGGIGLEIVEELPDVARVIVPVGGGGLISGVAGALKGCGRASRSSACSRAATRCGRARSRGASTRRSRPGRSPTARPGRGARPCTAADARPSSTAGSRCPRSGCGGRSPS